jgi:hypothetical protein
MSERITLIPDLGTDITEALDLVVRAFRRVEREGLRHGGHPPGFAVTPLLGSAQDLQLAIAPSQGVHAKRTRLGKMFAPDGQYQHIPFRLVPIRNTDLDRLRLVVAALGQPRLAAAVVSESRRPETPDETLRPPEDRTRILAKRVGQLASLLDLEHDADTRILIAAISGTDSSKDIVLTPAQEEAYQRTATRINDAWDESDPAYRTIY